MVRCGVLFFFIRGGCGIDLTYDIRAEAVFYGDVRFYGRNQLRCENKEQIVDFLFQAIERGRC